MFDRTFVIWWRSLSDVGTFGFAPGRQLKSFWLELSGWCAHLFLCHGWLGARSDPRTDASIARPWFVWKCWLYIWGLTCSFLQLKIYIWNHLKIERLIWHHVTKWTFGQVAHDNARACSDLCITLYCVYAIEGTLSLFFLLVEMFSNDTCICVRTVELCRTWLVIVVGARLHETSVLGMREFTFVGNSMKLECESDGML